MFGKTIKAVATATLMLTGALFTTTAHAQTATNLNCNKCVGTSDIARKAVTTSRLKNNAVTKRKIKNGAVTPAKLSDDAKPAGAANAYTDESATVIGAADIVQTVNVTTGSSGQLLVIATWQFGLNANEGGDCSITLDSTAFSTTFRNGSLTSNANAFDLHSSSVTGLFTGVSAGAHTVRLVCLADTGDGISVRKRSLSVLFVPGLI